MGYLLIRFNLLFIAMWYKVTFEDEKEYKKIKCVLMYATYPNHLLEQIKLLLQ